MEDFAVGERRLEGKKEEGVNGRRAEEETKAKPGSKVIGMETGKRERFNWD